MNMFVIFFFVLNAFLVGLFIVCVTMISKANDELNDIEVKCKTLDYTLYSRELDNDVKRIDKDWKWKTL